MTTEQIKELIEGDFEGGVRFLGEPLTDTENENTIVVKKIITIGHLIYSKDIDHLWIDDTCIQIQFKDGKRAFIKFKYLVTE